MNRVCQVGDKGCDDSFSSSSLNFFLKSERNLGGSQSLQHVVLNQQLKRGTTVSHAVSVSRSHFFTLHCTLLTHLLTLSSLSLA